jgi:hypothetical protein
MARKYPIGIQTFSEIIREGYTYVDKTDLVWQLAHYAKYIFLSRPRRFGKSLLTTTLDSYFKGEKELFEGLKMMNLEKEWQQYPVIRLDLSMAKNQDSPDALRDRLLLLLKRYKEKYGSDPAEKTPGGVLAGLIDRAYNKEGKQVVVLIDEYDAPLLDVLHENEMLAPMRKVMQEFYQPLKASEAMIKLCFITGITRLSQLNIFSTLNNLTNISLLPQFSSLCGITENELHNTLLPDIEALAERYKCSKDEMKNLLKKRYDGYHFSEESEDIYNPYSLLSAFTNKKISNYWFETGTPTFLIQMMRKFKYNITSMDDIETTDYAINRPTEAMTTMVPLLYQSGYLTIKSYDVESEIYTLSMPNLEVRIGYADGLLPAYVGLEGEDVQAGFALKFWRALKKGDVDLAMREMQTYMAAIPYIEGFKKKLAEAANAEGFYEYTMYLVFSMLNVYVRTQVKCAGGRTDLVVWMPDTIYVFELKVNGTAQEALKQIDEKSYAIPYQTDGRPVVKVGVKFDAEKRVPEEWVIGNGKE